MNAKVETQGSAADVFKLLISLLLVVGGAFAFNYYDDQSQLLRVVGILTVVIVALLIAAQTTRGRTALAFIRDARIEVRKVVWPTRAETMQTTMIVMLMVFVVGIVLWIMDTFLLWAIKFLTGQGS
ncbi:MAG TPA: preprotein translocase subunit SecE [Gammaproteobacteria bacterium]|nr:preprotein translocase subunit SecE [Gammaproteobacteria bacterium]